MSCSDPPISVPSSPQKPATVGPRVAYMMSRFPKITETFVLYEMLAAEQAGAVVEVFPLRRERTDRMHPEAVDFVDRAHFIPLLSWEVLRDNLRQLLKSPTLWLSTLWTIIRANIGCRRFLLGALAVFPKSVTMAKRMREAGVDHIHAHFASHPAAAAWMIHRFSGIPYSFVAHGSDLHRAQQMLSEKVRDAAFVVAISEYNATIIRQTAADRGAARIQVIHCGVQPEDFSADRSVGAEKAQLKVICIGTLHAVKGQRYLIDALQLLLKNRSPDQPTVTLYLVGDGPDETMLRDRVRQAGLQDRVVFAGRRDRHEIIQLLRTADLLVAPSVPTSDGRREGIPVVLMEGMASGLPVISSRLSGIPELVVDGEHGFLTEPGDVAAITDGLQKLCGDYELRNRMGAAGRQRVNEKFHLADNVQRVLQEINRVACLNSTVRPVAAAGSALPNDAAPTADSALPTHAAQPCDSSGVAAASAAAEPQESWQEATV